MTTRTQTLLQLLAVVVVVILATILNQGGVP